MKKVLRSPVVIIVVGLLALLVATNLFGHKSETKHISLFTKQLSILQDAGLPILRSLRILEVQQKAAG